MELWDPTAVQRVILTLAGIGAGLIFIGFLFAGKKQDWAKVAGGIALVIVCAMGLSLAFGGTDWVALGKGAWAMLGFGKIFGGA